MANDIKLAFKCNDLEWICERCEKIFGWWHTRCIVGDEVICMKCFKK